MGNSPVDKSKSFIESGMTLITQTSSDKHLNKINKHESLLSNGIQSEKERGSQKGKQI